MRHMCTGTPVHCEQTVEVMRCHGSWCSALRIGNHERKYNFSHYSNRFRMPGRGLHSFTFQVDLSRFGHTSTCPPV
jgi:hypothetical protein